MKAIKSIKINGLSVNKIQMGGGIMWQSKRYEELSYIEAYGEQWIDCGMPLTSEDDITLTGIEWATGGQLFGARESANANNIEVVTYDDDNFYQQILVDFNNSDYKLYRVVAHGVHRVDKVVLNRITRNMTVGNITIASNNAICHDTIITPTARLFATINPPGDSVPYRGKLNTLTIHRSGELVLDFHPVRDTQTGEIGMYDTVTKRFFRNQGSGAFGGGSPTGRIY